MYKIWVSKQDRAELIRTFNVTNATISYALNFKRMSESHSRIRNFAMNTLKGILIEGISE